MFVLKEWLADQGEPVEAVLMTSSFSIDELPHLSAGRYAGYMKETGIEGREGILDVLKTMERYGFLVRTGGYSFKFKAPVYRFVDLCHLVLQEHGTREEGG